MQEEKLLRIDYTWRPTAHPWRSTRGQRRHRAGDAHAGADVFVEDKVIDKTQAVGLQDGKADSPPPPTPPPPHNPPPPPKGCTSGREPHDRTDLGKYQDVGLSRRMAISSAYAWRPAFSVMWRAVPRDARHSMSRSHRQTKGGSEDHDGHQSLRGPAGAGGKRPCSSLSSRKPTDPVVFSEWRGETRRLTMRWPRPARPSRT